MNCSDAREHLIELVYGELASATQQSLETHLTQCATCRGQFQQLRQAHRFVEQTDRAGGEHRVDVGKVYASFNSRKELSRRRWRAAAIATGVAALLVMAAAMAQVRVQLDATQLTIGWGEPRPAPPVPTPIEDPWPAVEDLAHRLDTINDLSQLTAEQLLAAERDRAAELAVLHRRLDVLRRQTSAQLAAIQEQSDRRWRLIAEALAHQEALHASYVPARYEN